MTLPPVTPGLRAARGALALLLGLTLFAAVAEFAVRQADPTPRVLVVRPEAMLGERWRSFAVVEGVPLWREVGSEPRREPTCAAGAPEVWLAGDSVFFGSELPPEQAPGAALQRALDDAGLSACVRDLSQPGYGGLARWREVRAELAAGRRPAVVVIESWESDPMVLTPIDGDWYALGGLARDASGWPRAPLPVPQALHHAAFRHAEAWRLLTFVRVPQDEADMSAAWARYREQVLRPMVAAIRGAGGRAILAAVPRLDRPFAASTRAAWVDDPERARLAEDAAALDVPVVVLAERLLDHDVTTLAQDRCCHVSAAGARAYAEALLPEVREALVRP